METLAFLNETTSVETVINVWDDGHRNVLFNLESYHLISSLF